MDCTRRAPGPGLTLIYRRLDYGYSLAGLLLWLVFIVVISLVASIAPARRAAQLTIRKALAYDG